MKDEIEQSVKSIYDNVTLDSPKWDDLTQPQKDAWYRWLKQPMPHLIKEDRKEYSGYINLAHKF